MKRKKKGLYSLIGETVVGKVDPVMKNDLKKTTLQHVNERGLYQLQRQGLFCGEMIEKLEFCEHFVLRKSRRIKFTRTDL